MAAGTFTLFSANKDDINLNALVGATVKLALVTSAYTPDASVTGHTTWANISTHEIAAGNGYTAGGVTLASVAKTAITGGFKLASNNAVWTATSGSIPAWRYAVMYVSGTLWGLTNPLVGYVLADTTPADIPATTSGNLLTVVCPVDGWFDVT